MKTLLSFFAITMLVSAAGESKAHDEVMAAMDTFKNAMISRDGKALDRVLSDDLAYTHSAGEFQTKKDLIDSIVLKKTTVERLEFTDTTVRFYGNTALVKGRVDLWHSDTNIVHMNILHVWVKNPQGWQMVARQATKLAK